MVLLRIPLLLCVLMWCNPGWSFNLSGSRTETALPFLVDEYPSLISFQKGLFCGSRFSFYSADVSNKVTAGITRAGNTGGFSLAWMRESNSGYHHVHGGFSHRFGQFAYGGALFGHFGDAIGVNFDVSGSLALSKSENIIISINLRNLYPADTVFSFIKPTARVSLGGVIIPSARLFGDVGGYFLFSDYVHRHIGYGAFMDIKKNFLENPSLQIALKVEYDTIPSVRNSLTMTLGAGWFMKTGTIKYGFSGGYRHDMNEHRSGFYGSVFISPGQYRDTIAPVLSIGVSDTVFYPLSLGKKSRCIIGVTASDDKKGVGIKNWVCVISRTQSVDSSVVKVFAGGSIPPSSIVWDGKNSYAEFVRPGRYYIRFSVVDGFGNTQTSRWIKIVVGQ